MDSIRVVVVDDSAFMRKMITDILSSDNRIEVVATAKNGEDGLQKIADFKPDVVTLDVEMPIMDGITALRKLMQSDPLPVVMLSSVTEEGATKTVQAISIGAVDFVAKPSGAISLDLNKISEEILTKVLTAAQANISKSQPVSTTRKITGTDTKEYDKTIVGIGSSTGGPKALQNVLSDMPDDFQAAVLIVQHMPAGFTKSLAKRLDALVPIKVKEAVHGEIIQKSTAYIAPGNYHMKVRAVGTAYAIELTREKPVFGHRPAVDTLFESIANVQKVNKIAVVLTGMGSDGAEGINILKEKDPGAIIVAESEKSSVVYGMPKAAVKTNHVDHIVHLHQVEDTITKLVNRSRGM
ncbi:protein-glutamate methylesterase/protein-glutamine glutaminase [Virgibacillus doumboii]|uniref:protein-glutamate methylesterase/protein-glutamine glutaminase n=1 Tax=Virgibacillus doumboii TaxID=2697503 RepID=UPI0013E02660|nr:chemotaxis response regulator protein-glutamate methylesterase [Virgibacillus doumboii]